MKTLSIIAAAVLSVNAMADGHVQNNLDISGAVSAGMGGTIASISKTDLQGVDGRGFAADMGTANLNALAKGSIDGASVVTEVQGAANSANEAVLDAKGLTTGLANGVSAGLGIGGANGAVGINVEIPALPALPTIVIE